MNDRVLKESVEFLIGPFTRLINECFMEGICLGIFKMSIILLSCKKGDIDIVDNYSPISVIAIFSKVLEILIKTRLYNYLKTQFGSEGLETEY